MVLQKGEHYGNIRTFKVLKLHILEKNKKIGPVDNSEEFV